MGGGVPLGGGEGDVSGEEQLHGPVDQDPQPLLGPGQLPQVDAAPQQPGGQAGEAHPAQLGGGALAAQRHQEPEAAEAERLGRGAGQGGDHVVGNGPALAGRVLGRGRAGGAPPGQIGDAGAVPHRPDVVAAPHPQGPVDRDRPDAGRGPPERSSRPAGQRHRAGSGPRGPDQGAGRHPLAVAELDPVGVGAGHRHPEAQLDPAGDQLVAGVAGQPVAQLGQDALARVDQHEAGLAGADVGEVAEDAVDQVEEAGHGLGAGEAAAGDDEGEPAAPLGRVGLVVGLLEPPEDVVAQPPRVLEGGQGEGVGGHPGQVAEVGHRPHGQHQLVVRQGLQGVAPAQVDDPPVGVDAEHLAPAEAGPGAGRPQRHPHVAGLDRAGRDLGQHRREQQVVALADQGHVQPGGPGEELLEAAGGADAAEPAAEDHDPLGAGPGRGDRRQPPGPAGPQRRLDARADHAAGAEAEQQGGEQRRHRHLQRRQQREDEDRPDQRTEEHPVDDTAGQGGWRREGQVSRSLPLPACLAAGASGPRPQVRVDVADAAFGPPDCPLPPRRTAVHRIAKMVHVVGCQLESVSGVDGGRPPGGAGQPPAASSRPR